MTKLLEQKWLSFISKFMGQFSWLAWFTVSLSEGQKGPEFPRFQRPHHSTVKATEGQPVYLDCNIFRIGAKTVTWTRHHNGSIELLTYGLTAFHDDQRFSLRFQEPRNWRLRINALKKEDSGQYVCQISSDPPMKKKVILQVQNPRITIKDENAFPVRKLFYAMNGQAVSFECFTEPVSVYTTSLPLWTFNNSTLKQRNGNSWIETLKTETSFSLWLHLKEIRLSDAGVYSCSMAGSPGPSVILHVFNDTSAGSVLRHFHTYIAAPFLISIFILR